MVIAINLRAALFLTLRRKMSGLKLHTSPPNITPKKQETEESHYFDHVVIGAGIVGSCTAWQLAKTGRSVLLVEQFPLPHTWGSSHGQSRITRSCYIKDYHAALMPPSLAGWDEIEKESNSKLIHRSGGICFTMDSNVFDAIQKNMEQFSPEHLQILTQEDINQYVCLNYHYAGRGILDKSAGVIYANKALAAVQELFRKNGGCLWDSCEVPCYALDLGDSVCFRTNSHGAVKTPSLIVCAGAWTPELFQFKVESDLYDHLRSLVQAEAVNVYYWPETAPGAHADCPVILDSNDPHIYTLPSIEYPGMVKLCVHKGTPCSINRRAEAVYPESYVDAMKFYIKDHFPYIMPRPGIIEKCMYATTPDEDFILGNLPGHSNVLIACGFSGTGFKTAPLIGKVLCALAQGKESPVDVSRFTLSRFERKET